MFKDPSANELDRGFALRMQQWKDYRINYGSIDVDL